MKQGFGGIFENKTVLITGHTGFKGAWLALWLQQLGANVVGYSLPKETTPSNFSISEIAQGMVDCRGDICNYQAFKHALDEHLPVVIFHLAAQPIVMHGYHSPKETFDVNVSGTINVLEAARNCPSVKAMIMITSDKCYENNEWLWGYRENDSLGSGDPYSASKAMAETAIASYRTSFAHQEGFPAIASARAGNVIGGGDFSDYRIVPDCMRSLMANEPIRVRNPKSVRPWLHVLDALSGYLSLGAHLLSKGNAYADAWNFGPLETRGVDVQTLAEQAIIEFGDGDWLDISQSTSTHEMGQLRLNWDKAAMLLAWNPTYTWIQAISQTVDWFKGYQATCQNPTIYNMRDLCIQHLHHYTDQAKDHQCSWALHATEGNKTDALSSNTDPRRLPDRS